MRNREAPSLWKQIGHESLWGRRGIVKTGSLWLPLAVVVAETAPVALARAWVPCLQLFLAAVCRTLAVILANDLTDRADDLAAGKDRWILRLRPAAGAMVVAGLVAVGLLSLAIPRPHAWAVCAWLAALALGLAYSIRPLRFKERGLLGPLAYALHGALAYVAVTWLWLGAGADTLAVLAAAVFLDKWVNIHFHQVIDHAADSAQGCRTLAVRLGLPRARAALQVAAAAAALAMAAVLALIAVRLDTLGLVAAGVGLATFLAAGGHALLARRGSRPPSALIRELPWPYLGLSYALFCIVPLVILGGLSLREPTLWAPTAIAAVVTAIETWLASSYKYA